MSYTIFLDDERFPVSDSSVILRSFDDAVAHVISNGVPDHVDFDHDLGEGRNGHDFAKWLVDRALDGYGFPKSYAVHSQNPIGASNIRATMDAYWRFIA
jgi:hypothetical protein